MRRGGDHGQIIGGIASTHVPAIGKAIAENKQNDPYWKPFFNGFDYVHDWLAREKPDVAVVFYNDHGLNFFLDKLPTFAVGAASEYRNEDEGWGIPVSPLGPGRPGPVLAPDQCPRRRRVRHHHVPGDAGRPRRDHPDDADVAGRALAGEDRAGLDQHRAASAALARALPQARPLHRPCARNLPARICASLVVGTGGLSHQLDGERAGFINKEFDQLCLDKIVNDPEALTRYSIHDWVELAGAQGVEFLNWMAMRGALTGRVTQVHRNYHIPISNTAAATIVLENAGTAARHAA